MAKIPIFLANGQPRTIDYITNEVDGSILGDTNSGPITLAPGLRMVDIKLADPLEPGHAPYITACVRINQTAL